MLILLPACERGDSSHRFAVNVTIDSALEVDSAELLIFEADYGSLRWLGATAVGHGKAKIEGMVDEAHAACLRLDGVPFYFVLDPGETSIAIAPERVTVTGGRENHRYMAFVKRHATLSRERAALWARYEAMGADSTLTRDKETAMARRDSVLADSLQRITLAAIRAPYPSARLVTERYITTLDSVHLEQLSPNE